MLPDFYTATEAATKMGISRSQVYRRIEAGLLPSEQVGNQLLIPVADVIKLMKKTPLKGRFRKEGAGSKPAAAITLVAG